MSKILIILKDELLSSKIKKLRKQKKYRSDTTTLPPEFDVNLPKPRFIIIFLLTIYDLIVFNY